MRRHRKYDAIVRLIGEGRTNTGIGRELRVERQLVGHIRREIGVPNVDSQPLTLEEKWQSFTRPVEGGHLEWTGERQTTSGTPVMRYRERSYTAARIAFEIRTGREPVGYARAECGVQHCVEPSHVDDMPTRLRDREQLRYISGGQERPARCVHNHDQAMYGRYLPGGAAYCGECARLRKLPAVATRPSDIPHGTTRR